MSWFMIEKKTVFSKIFLLWWVECQERYRRESSHRMSHLLGSASISQKWHQLGHALLLLYDRCDQCHSRQLPSKVLSTLIFFTLRQWYVWRCKKSKRESLSIPCVEWRSMTWGCTPNTNKSWPPTFSWEGRSRQLTLGPGWPPPRWGLVGGCRSRGSGGQTPRWTRVHNTRSVDKACTWSPHCRKGLKERKRAFLLCTPEIWHAELFFSTWLITSMVFFILCRENWLTLILI